VDVVGQHAPSVDEAFCLDVVAIGPEHRHAEEREIQKHTTGAESSEHREALCEGHKEDVPKVQEDNEADFKVEFDQAAHGSVEEEALDEVLEELDLRANLVEDKETGQRDEDREQNDGEARAVSPDEERSAHFHALEGARHVVSEFVHVLRVQSVLG